MNGADAEVREEEINPALTDHDMDPMTPPVPVPQGTNRGSNTELATRRKDSTSNSGDRSSAIYLKFDISTIPDNIPNQTVTLRMFVRNANQIRASRTVDHPPFGNNTDNELFTDPVEMKFAVLGLTNFALNNWAENTITWYNAPGITPDSMISATQDPGKYNFNTDMRVLGTFKYPTVPPQNALAVGQAVDFTDTDGLLRDLIQEAKDAGQTHVTLVVHHGLNGFQATTAELTADPTIQATPNEFLNFNYLFIPKEMTTLNTDAGWDADTTNPNNPLGGPNSGAANNGQFSPQLIIVPEPYSVALLAIAMLTATALRRRQN
jgi:hypothetical protein